ncbi:MAG: long-chain fatty acid--CoA ligase [Hyphomicrobiaceae bacterium]
MLNLADFLDRNSGLFPSQAAIVHGERRLTYGELRTAAQGVAAGLQRIGIVPGDKVALSCPNVPEFAIAYYGILMAGAVVVPLNILLKPGEIAYHLTDSEARAYLCYEGLPELPMAAMAAEAFKQVAGCGTLVVMPAGGRARAEGLAGLTTLAEFTTGAGAPSTSRAMRPDDTAVILYTSGTTGTAKGAELTHANMAMNALVTALLFKLSWSDVNLLALPLFHSFGQTCQLNASVIVGATMVMLPRFDPEAALRLMVDEKVSVFAGVPTMHIGLIGAAERLPEIGGRVRDALRLAVSGGASLPLEVLAAFDRTFGVPMLEGYGLSEVSPVATFNHPDRTRRPGTVGQAIAGTEVRVVDLDGRPLPAGAEGEVEIRGHNVMKGYYRRPEATADVMRDGWFRTGDIGRMTEDGYLAIVDRLKDMVIRGGYNVYPREVEEVLMQHPAVAMVAVIGVPHATLGEEIVAYVVAKPGAAIDGDEVVAFARERLAAFKYPRRVEIVPSLPLNATGKILKRALRDLAKGKG